MCVRAHITQYGLCKSVNDVYIDSVDHMFVRLACVIFLLIEVFVISPDISTADNNVKHLIS